LGTFGVQPCLAVETLFVVMSEVEIVASVTADPPSVPHVDQVETPSVW
jgi:hypothetical protein